VPSDVAPPVVLNSAPTYIAFGYLLLVGVLLAFAKTLTLFVAALVFAVIGWVWLCGRSPRTMFILTSFLRGRGDFVRVCPITKPESVRRLGGVLTSRLGLVG
jgi:hypothetical protein